ncbi:transposase [Oceanimonas sp. GK1]|nr:transposase [Oceanimonas sp. GK1]
MGAINSAQLVLEALEQAWQHQRPDGTQLLFHSDQGSQYRSEEVMRWLTTRGITISMSRRGNCWDNACSESFFALLKKEWTHPLGMLEETKWQMKSGIIRTSITRKCGATWRWEE